ncbi:hypothetical protein BDZ97DRAFT_1797242 [Flammula alnicola]|nr:hypothetical protein BDZ97DRAFT_1797242 [Flammula alnicola]
MKFFINTLVFAVLAFVSLVSSAPVQLSARDVFVPPVLTPNVHSVWKVGSTQTVTWDLTDAPTQITNSKAKVILVTDGLLDLDNPLADGVDVRAGQCQVTVPNVAPGDNYQILVFGDSGNRGQFFTITN